MSNSSTAFTLPDGYCPPFSIVTDDNHTAWIIIPAALGIALSLLFAGIRLFVRRVISPGIGSDDILLGVATIFAVIQSSLILVACGLGLGKSAKLIDTESMGGVEQLYYAATIFLAPGLGVSKASVVAFLLRIAPFDPQRRFIQILFALIVAWTVTLIFTLALRCNLAEPWELTRAGCAAETITRWEILDTLGCLFELAIFAISIWLIWGVAAIRRGNKAIVIVMFTFRLHLIVFAVFRLRSYVDTDRADRTLADTEFIAWSQAELNYSLISSTILIMRPFFNNLVTHYGNNGTTSGPDEACLMHSIQSGSPMPTNSHAESLPIDIFKGEGSLMQDSQAALIPRSSSGDAGRSGLQSMA